MIKKILIALVILIAAFLIVVALQPDTYRVARSTTTTAPVAVIFDEVNDLHKWDAWSPWAKLDPAVKNTFTGSASGTGAVFGWVGNDKVGEGRMTIKESRPHERIAILLEFIKPFPSEADVEFMFQTAGNQTTVTWAMSGHKNFLSKGMCMFMNMDKMIGGDFEKGLANLKSVSESPR